MCDPVTIMAASAGAQALGTIQQGRAARKAADFQAGQEEYQAALAQDRGQAEAALIRRRGRVARGELVASTGASGVAIDDWSSADLERQVMQDTEQDALLAILDGDRNARQLRQQAQMTRRSGRNAQRAAYLSAASSLLAAGASSGRWGKSGGVKPTTGDFARADRALGY